MAIYDIFKIYIIVLGCVLGGGGGKRKRKISMGVGEGMGTWLWGGGWTAVANYGYCGQLH